MSVKEVPPAATALGISLQVACGENVQMVLQTHVALDAGPEEHRRTVDLACQMADRVRDRYLIDALRAQIKKIRGDMQFGEENLARDEARYVAASEQRIAQSRQAAADDEMAWKQRENRGDYKPREATIKRMAALENEQMKADEDRARVRFEHEMAIVAMTGKIATLEAEIAALQEKLDAPVRVADC